MPRPPLVPGWIAFLSLGILTPATAQSPEALRQGKLSVGLSIGTTVFSGAARGTGDLGEPLVFTPHRPTMLGVGVSYGRGRLRLEASARVGEPGLAIRGVPVFNESVAGKGVLIIVENAFRVRSFSAGASARLVRLRGGPVLRFSAETILERWSAPDEPVRTIAGGQAGLAMEVALTGSLAARAEGSLGLTPASPFRQEDLPAGFRQSGTWRRTLGVGVSWRP